MVPGPPRPIVGTIDEPIHLLAEGTPYLGQLPAYYEPDVLPEADLLVTSAAEIRDEVLASYRAVPHEWSVNFTPIGYAEPGWTTLNLFTLGRRYHHNCAVLPRTTSLVESLPGMASAQISVLAPGTELIAHRGDTNVMFRTHLGLVVPASPPELAMEVDGEVRGWVEGELLVFEDVHVHRVWNRTDSPRVVLLLDLVKPELRSRQRWMMALAASGVVVQVLATRVPGFARLPSAIRRVVLRAGAVAAWVVTPIQRRLRWLPF